MNIVFKAIGMDKPILMYSQIWHPLTHWMNYKLKLVKLNIHFPKRSNPPAEMLSSHMR